MTGVVASSVLSYIKGKCSAMHHRCRSQLLTCNIPRVTVTTYLHEKEKEKKRKDYTFQVNLMKAKYYSKLPRLPAR